jgi:hypothetical protein
LGKLIFILCRLVIRLAPAAALARLGFVIDGSRVVYAIVAVARYQTPHYVHGHVLHRFESRASPDHEQLLEHQHRNWVAGLALQSW